MGLEEIENVEEYFCALRDLRGMTVLIAVKDTPGVAFDFSCQESLRRLGLRENIMDAGWRGYLAIVHDGTVLRESFGGVGEKLETDCSLSEGLDVRLGSEPFNNGNKAEIIVNGTDYAVNRRGLNIVVWDTIRKELVDSVCFDTHSRIHGCIRKTKPVKRPTYDRKEVLKHSILTREVILWGNEWVAVDFYDKYRDVLNITKVVTGKESELSGRKVIPDLPLERFRPEAVRNAYVVVCRSNLDEYYGATDGLRRSGLPMGERFARYDMVDAILSGKKIFAFVGYCQIESIYHVLKNCPTVVKTFFCQFYHIERVTKRGQRGFSDFAFGVQMADVMARVFDSVMFNENSIDYDIEENLASECNVIMVPQLLFSGFMPYSGINFRELNEDARTFGRLEYPFLYKQKILNNLVLQGMTNSEIFEEVSREDLFSEKEIKHHFKIAMRFLENQSEQSDIPIYDYIQENILKKRLHRDGLHYENPLRFELARRLLKYMNISCEDEVDDYEEFCDKFGGEFFYSTQVPILPCVIKCLNIEFENHETFMYRLNIDTWNGTRYVNFKDWIYEYCDFLRAALKIKEIMSVH